MQGSIVICEPTTLALATFAVGATQAVTGAIGQQQRYDQNAENVRVATADSYAYSQLQANQTRDAAVGRKINESIQTSQVRSTAAAAAGEAGVSGYSVDALLEDFMGREGRFNANVDANTGAQLAKIEGDMKSTQARGQSQINSVSQPNILDTGLKIAGAGLNSASGYYRNTRSS